MLIFCRLNEFKTPVFTNNTWYVKTQWQCSRMRMHRLMFRASVYFGMEPVLTPLKVSTIMVSIEVIAAKMVKNSHLLYYVILRYIVLYMLCCYIICYIIILYVILLCYIFRIFVDLMWFLDEFTYILWAQIWETVFYNLVFRLDKALKLDKYHNDYDYDDGDNDYLLFRLLLFHHHFQSSPTSLANFKLLIITSWIEIHLHLLINNIKQNIYRCTQILLKNIEDSFAINWSY